LPTENVARLATAAERDGDFSIISKQLVNPHTGVAYVNNYIDRTFLSCLGLPAQEEFKL
jgi:hypothetical protein